MTTRLLFGLTILLSAAFQLFGSTAARAGEMNCLADEPLPISQCHRAEWQVLHTQFRQYHGK
jgi:hypothetical protein